jgi:hypothetical protein
MTDIQTIRGTCRDEETPRRKEENGREELRIKEKRMERKSRE